MTPVFVLLGVAAGVLQALLLRRSATAGAPPHPLVAPARLLLVGAVLTAAALSGHLLAGAVGWLVGFAVGAALLVGGIR